MTAVVSQIIEDQKRQIAQLTHELTHDELTNIHNRKGLKETAKKLSRAGHEEATIACLDIDNFKDYNDAKGHAAGDELLVTVAQCLEVIAAAHAGIAVRLGGDEFALVIPDTDETIAEDIVQCVQGCCVSIGVTMGDPFELSKLLRNADVALYHSKRADGSKWTLWYPGLDMPQPGDRRAIRGLGN